MSKKYRLGYPEDRAGLSDDDVVSAPGGLCFGMSDMVKMNSLMTAIISWTTAGRFPPPEHKWFTEEGFRCEVLRASGGGWMKGRFRFRLEFIPDEPALPPQKDPNSPT
ncbi:hypothetical protein ACX27_14690 [Nostoc piscinale CENA21]|uniref:KGK domain-containing protein n=1 Tax=Nostoc piscinale CENA21 TaxID=224013 RepID=A0A0M5MML7_9NOSO|nr:KGK domain-containing protein [Nostoc piscinale]ALF53812.1 hypothetical protein ACX27_14690 [Nostoc piscinale CENA21]